MHYTYVLCNKGFSRLERLKRHMRVHTGNNLASVHQAWQATHQQPVYQLLCVVSETVNPQLQMSSERCSLRVYPDGEVDIQVAAIV